MSKGRVMKNFDAGEEELLRGFLFTNPGGDDGFVYPQELVVTEELAPLMSAYSRSHVPFQERVLTYLDRHKDEQTRAMLPLIPQLMDITRNPDGTLRLTAKTAIFNRQWPQRHGHDSIKEEVPLVGHSERISDITGKRITGHPLNHPQVKSTRYLHFGRGDNVEDEDLRALDQGGRFLEYQDWMNQRYVDMTGRLRDVVFDHSDTARVVEFLRRPENVEAEVEAQMDEMKAVRDGYEPSEGDRDRARERVLKGLEDEGVRKAVGNFVLDSSRIYLTAATKTSLGFVADARTLESILTGMISSQRSEDVRRGRALWEQAQKVAPVLLGEKSHVRVDAWRQKNETELREFLQERFAGVEPLEGKPRVRVWDPTTFKMYDDRFNAAMVAFPYLDLSVGQIADEISAGDAVEILERAHKNRGQYDLVHPAIAHGGLMSEFVMGYHGYRDLFRHRRGSRSVQLLTTRLGFEVPKIFETFGMGDEVRADMEKAAEIYELAREQDPHVAEKVVPFGALCRSLHSWQPDQMAYVARLRTNAARGNISYVNVARDMIGQVADLMPETARYFRADTQEYPAHLWKRGYEWYDSERRGRDESKDS
ncbi:MAG: hypothetical protein ABH864_04765 [archaeon]